MSEEKLNTVYLVSDGTCRTCEQVIKATLVQFEEDVHVVRKAKVRRPKTVWDLVRRAADDEALVFYTLVVDQARDAMQEAARRPKDEIIVVNLSGRGDKDLEIVAQADDSVAGQYAKDTDE